MKLKTGKAIYEGGRLRTATNLFQADLSVASPGVGDAKSVGVSIRPLRRPVALFCKERPINFLYPGDLTPFHKLVDQSTLCFFRNELRIPLAKPEHRAVVTTQPGPLLKDLVLPDIDVLSPLGDPVAHQVPHNPAREPAVREPLEVDLLLKRTDGKVCLVHRHFAFAG